MAASFDCAVSSLLCAEENESIFDDADYGVVEDNFRAAWQPQNHRTHDQDQSFSSVLPLQSDDCLDLMLKKECQQLPAGDYLNRLRSGDLDLRARMEAIDWIGKVHARFNFGSSCAYLSVTYLDRFLSAYELPKGKTWMMQLLAVACLSIAAKMEETEVPLTLDLQVGESKFVFEGRTIQRMELLVLSTLKWRMQAITPFSFLDYFLNKLNDFKRLPASAITHSISLVSGMIKGTDFLEFKPSEVAAAVAISVVGETRLVIDTEKAASILTRHVQKEKMLKCVEMINDLGLRGSGALVSSVPQSPIGVLEAACLSYKSEDSMADSCVNSPSESPASKRRKLNRHMGTQNSKG